MGSVERFGRIWGQQVRNRRRTSAQVIAGFALLVSVFGAPGAVAADHPAGAGFAAARWEAAAPTAGSTLWRSTYNGQANSADQGAAVAVSPDGSKVFVTGQSYGASANADFATVAYDASSGSQLWASRYAAAAGGNDAPIAIAVSPDGSKVFVTGKSWGGSTAKDDYATVAYAAATGDRLWAKRYNAGALDQPYAIAVSPDGARVFVTGSSQGGSPLDWDYATLGYDATTGTRLWKRRFNGGFGDNATGLAVSPDSKRVYVGGTRYGGPSNDTMDYQAFAYDAATGVRDWSMRYNGGWDDYASTLAAGSGTDVFITGASYDGSTFFNKTVAYGAGGARLWVAKDGSTDYFDTTLPAVHVSPDGSQVLTLGSTFDSTDAHDYATYAYDTSTGHLDWSRRYNSSGFSGDLPAGAVFSPDGSQVYVTGRSASGPDTFAYDDATGAVVWSKRANVNPMGIAVSPDGSTVFLVGTVVGSSTGADIVTVAIAA